MGNNPQHSESRKNRVQYLLKLSSRDSAKAEYLMMNLLYKKKMKVALMETGSAGLSRKIWLLLNALSRSTD